MFHLCLKFRDCINFQ